MNNSPKFTIGDQVTILGSGQYGLVTNTNSGIAVSWDNVEAVRAYMAQCERVSLTGSDHDMATNSIQITVVRKADDAERTAKLMKECGYQKVVITSIKAN